MLRHLSCAAIGLSAATFIGAILVVGDVGRRLDDLEKQARTQHSLMVMCLNSINELANPGSSITLENTVPEVRK